MPRGETAPDETWIQVRIPKSVREELEAMVGVNAPSISWVARTLILEGLAARQGRPGGPPRKTSHPIDSRQARRAP